VIRFNDPEVYDVRTRTAGVDHFTVVSLATFAGGGTARHCGDQ